MSESSERAGKLNSYYSSPTGPKSRSTGKKQSPRSRAYADDIIGGAGGAVMSDDSLLDCSSEYAISEDLSDYDSADCSRASLGLRNYSSREVAEVTEEF